VRDLEIYVAGKGIPYLGSTPMQPCLCSKSAWRVLQECNEELLLK